MKDVAPADADLLFSLATTLDQHATSTIFPFWHQTMDTIHGGFAGLVKNDNAKDFQHIKGLVMHSRHLWTYSQAWLHYRDPQYLPAMRQAFNFLTSRLYDHIGKGFWWTVDNDGIPEFENKVLYGQAFAIYGLARYYQATQETPALNLALETFALLEGTGHDPEFGGYYEAVDRTWSKPLVQALSPVDIPCSKSMNTNLHILEAYSALYIASGLPEVKLALTKLLQVFEDNILVTPEHLGLYFTDEWKNLTSQISYGHDIEASWLMTEAAQMIWGQELPPAKRDRYAKIARRTLELLIANNGSLPHELHNGHLDTSRIWWVQAEAMVGMVNAWELTSDSAFLAAAESVWRFIDAHMVDRTHGEWFWQVDPAGHPALEQPKGGLWKTGYHNGRACMEIIQRANHLKSRLKEQ